MFSGIVEEVGRVEALDGGEEGASLRIAARTVLGGTRLGDSIAVPREPCNREEPAMARHRALATLAGLLAATLTLPAAVHARGDCRGQEATTWSIRVAAEDEPGQQLVVSGVVQDEDGKPLPGMTVFVFHTDASGFYSEGGTEESNARLCGLMLTDERGRYRFETIRPAHYATGGPPAHVHYRVWGPGVPRQNLTLNFEGDPRLGARGRDASANPTWATIRPAETAEDGTLHVLRDLRVRTR